MTHAHANAYTPKLNENCVDDIIGKICNEQCVGILVQCTIGMVSIRYLLFAWVAKFRVGLRILPLTDGDPK